VKGLLEHLARGAVSKRLMQPLETVADPEPIDGRTPASSQHLPTANTEFLREFGYSRNA
jgi:hypothetical protein